MALRIVADTLDELPKGLREKAKPEGAVFVVPALEEGWAIEDVAALKRSLSEARSERDAAKATAKAFEGLAPESAAEAREALEKLKAGQLRGSREIDEYKASIEAKMATEKSALEAKLRARTDDLRKRMVRGELAPIIAQHGGSESMDAILTLAEQHIRIAEEADGTLKHSIVDRDGKSRVTKKSGSADPLGLDELIVEMRDAPSTRGLFRSTATGGSGGGSQTGGAGRAADSNGHQLSELERLARALKQGV